jgi:hypothetical protein
MAVQKVRTAYCAAPRGKANSASFGRVESSVRIGLSTSARPATRLQPTGGRCRISSSKKLDLDAEEETGSPDQRRCFLCNLANADQKST